MKNVDKSVFFLVNCLKFFVAESDVVKWGKEAVFQIQNDLDENKVQVGLDLHKTISLDVHFSSFSRAFDLITGSSPSDGGFKPIWNETSWKFSGKKGKLNISNFMKTGQTPSANELHVMWLKAPEQLINRPWYEIGLWPSLFVPSTNLGGRSGLHLRESVSMLVHRCTCMWIFARVYGVLCTSGGASLWSDIPLIDQPRSVFTHSPWSTFSAPTVFHLSSLPIKCDQANLMWIVWAF